MIKTRDERAIELTRKSKVDLARQYMTGVQKPDGSLTYSLHPVADLMKWRKDELVSSILSIEYPS